MTVFRTLLTVGRLIQFIAALVPIGGILLAIASATSPYGQGSALWIALSGILTGLILYGFGGLISVNVMAYRNSQRIAGALNRMARAQTGVAEYLPPPQEYPKPPTQPKRPTR
jgi:hypothetical protein